MHLCVCVHMYVCTCVCQGEGERCESATYMYTHVHVGTAASTKVFDLEGAATFPWRRGKATAEGLSARWSQLAGQLLVQVRQLIQALKVNCR